MPLPIATVTESMATTAPVASFKGSQWAGYYTFFHCCLILPSSARKRKMHDPFAGPLKRYKQATASPTLPRIQPTCRKSTKNASFPLVLNGEPGRYLSVGNSSFLLLRKTERGCD